MCRAKSSAVQSLTGSSWQEQGWGGGARRGFPRHGKGEATPLRGGRRRAAPRDAVHEAPPALAVFAGGLDDGRRDALREEEAVRAYGSGVGAPVSTTTPWTSPSTARSESLVEGLGPAAGVRSSRTATKGSVPGRPKRPGAGGRLRAPRRARTRSGGWQPVRRPRPRQGAGPMAREGRHHRAALHSEPTSATLRTLPVRRSPGTPAKHPRARRASRR